MLCVSLTLRFNNSVNGLTAGNLEQVWQRERDIMDYSYRTAKDQQDRSLSIVLADKKYAEYATARADDEETNMFEFFTTKILGLK